MKYKAMYLCRNFVIQDGDPASTGKGGESIWGKPFKDEVNSKLLHSGRGVVSMKNSGPHTNGSQFFILYKSANHLNFKHTIFGGVFGGLTTLAAMEKVPVDDNYRPLVSSLFRINLSKTTYILNLYLIFTAFCFTIKWYSLTDDRCSVYLAYDLFGKQDFLFILVLYAF
ncbi:hypothetical protein Patl1_10908 [Pistacia atlantica]|uniref:Uncharacterized protein n=1 Tax=Pistacia atlantica TaxID=434234 RepID=A0ACC1A9W0_9ROSI|nr:hypothetical protein Patl1_10908 [Pistacia atlantica]